MTKSEFQNSPEPLVMIISINPESGEVMYDSYHPDTVEGYMERFENDFPDHLHFQKSNKAAIELRKQQLGFTETSA